jgi:hypothetical protein
MKRTRFVIQFLAVLTVFVSLSGCIFTSPAVTNNVDDVLLRARDVTKLAVQQADEAKAAQKLASQISDGSKLQQILDDADDAARLAQQHADDVARLQNQVDDVALQKLLAAEATKANEAARQASIAAAITRLRLVTYQTRIDEISSGIVQNNLKIEDEFTEELVKEVLTKAFCFTVASALSGYTVSMDDIQQQIQDRAESRGLILTNVEEMLSNAIANETNRLVESLQSQEDRENYIEACEAVLELP